MGDESNHETVCPDDVLFRVLKAIANEKETEIINQIGEVNPNTMEIVSGKWELEDHLSKTGVNLSDNTVDSLITSEVLYKSFEKRINTNRKGKRKLVNSSGNGKNGFESTSGSETDGEQQQQQVTENKTVAMYKFVGHDRLYIAVDSTTKEFISKPSKFLIGTIHLRRRQIFMIFDPYPPTIGIPAKCL